MATRHVRDAHLPLKLIEELPLDGHGRTVRELMIRLGLADTRTAERRIQRQLDRLCDADVPRAERMPEQINGDHPRVLRYRRLANTPSGGKLSRSKRLSNAIQARLVLDHLRPVLPFEFGATLTASLVEAQSEFERLRSARQVVWTDRVRVAPAGHPLKAPVIDPKVQQEVEKAIDRGVRLRLSYSRYPKPKPMELTCDPLGLLFRPPVLYLIARNKDGEERQFALHRILAAESLSEPAALGDFNIDRCIQSGWADIAWSNAPVRVVVAANDTFARIWHGTPLGDNQTIAAATDVDYPWRVSATVPDSHLMRAYLLSLGTEAVVLEPASVADWVEAQATQMAAEIRSRRKGKIPRRA
jgi:predicted DNA-binding transcriptional regulator YafY